MNKEIYEIYRACRLCGAGAGYKMPIIQSIIGVSSSSDEEIELEEKIKECVQIEVSLHDRMPPLICELCVDKIHEFFVFRKMCHENNRKTRLRLGIPLQVKKSLAAEIIAGATEPLNEESDDGEPLSRHQPGTQRPRPKSAKIKKENELNNKFRNTAAYERSRSPSIEFIERRETRNKRAPSPKRATRQNRTEEGTLTHLQGLQIAQATPAPKVKPAPKSAKRDRERRTELERDTEDDESADDNSLLVPRNKRSREVALETPPPVKKTKITPPPPPKPERPKAGPKSAKEALTPTPPSKTTKAGPKSKTIEIKPDQPIATKSKKTETLESTPKSKRDTQPVVKSKSEMLPKPGPKSRKVESVIETTPTPKGKKREDPAPGPKSKRQREESPQVVRAPSPPKSFDCSICTHATKSSKGLNLHLKIHAPTYTTPELACNACELWFPNVLAANTHVKQHMTQGRPYTCAKCYDDFRTAHDYELHFTRNQCLQTYEVPDVKCEECWKMYPTYKLLEDHKCLGEGARPGGKCPKCKRVYASQRSLVTHELRCTVGRKRAVEPPKEVPLEPKVDPEVSSRLLPMQVRIVRCDTLLTTSHDGQYDVKELSHRFGLDRNSTYPYLNSMGDIKEPATTYDHMVAIEDNIKRVYLNTEHSFIHWDSDKESDDDDLLSSPNSLSTISLKTLFSPKLLGKVPKKKRNVKSEKGFDSIPSIDFNVDVKKNIDHLIDSLSNSDNYDSDSILDKGSEKKKDESNVIEILKENIYNNIENLEAEAVKTKETNKSHEEIDKNDVDESVNDDDALEMNIDTENNTQNVNKEYRINEPDRMGDERINDVDALEMNIDPENNTQNDNKDNRINESDKIDNRQVNEDLNEVTNDIIARIEECKSLDLPQCIDSKVIENNDESSKIIEDNVNQNSGNKTSPKKNGHLVSMKSMEDKSLQSENKVENKMEQTEIDNIGVNEQNLDKSNSNDEQDDVSPSNTSHQSETNDTIENSSNVGVEMQMNENNDSSDTGTDLPFNVEENETNNEKEAYLMTNENQDISYATNNKENENSNENNVPIDTAKDISQENDEPNAHDNLTNRSNSTENETTDLESSKNEKTSQNEETVRPNISEENLITESDLFDTKSIKSVDKFNINNLDEEDKLLMAELDAQIGENQPENNAIGQNESQRDVFGDRSDDNNATREINDVIGENSSVIDQSSDMIGQYSNMIGQDSNVIGQNSDAIGNINSELVTENKSANFGNSDSLTSNNYSIAAILNEGFGEEKPETLDELINKQENLKSLDLDSISDDDFNFDI